MGAVFSSACGGDVLRHWAETIGLIRRALRNSALTGTFGPCVPIPGAGRGQSRGNAVSSPGFTRVEQAGPAPDGSAGIRDVPLDVSAPQREQSCAGRGAQGATFYLFFGFSGNSAP